MDTKEYRAAEADLCVELMCNPKAVKVTVDFLHYLESKYAGCTELALSLNVPDEGISFKFMGIPLLIDNTIDNPYYEVVY